MRMNSKLSACVVMAIAGSSMSALGNDWAAAVDGNWNDPLNWIGGVPDTDTEDAVLGLAGLYAVELNGNYSINSLMITNSDATLNINSNRTLTMDSAMLNHGTVFVNSGGTGFNAHLSFAADATISGTGSILLNAQTEPGDAQILANSSTVTNESGHLIHGSGLLSGNMINNGNIIADDALSAGLQLSGTLTQSASGNAGADGGTMILGGGSVTTGGEFITANGGTIHNSSGTATIGNITNSGDITIAGNGNFIAMSDSVLNNGTITLNSNLSNFNAHLYFNATASISGNGSVFMNSNGDLGDAQLYTNGGFDGTIGVNQTVSGSGLVDGRSGGTIVNNGTIAATDAAAALGLAGNHRGSGGGVYRADDGVMDLRNGAVFDGGTFDSSGTGIVDVASNGTPTLSGVTNLGAMGIRGQGGGISLTGNLTNNGTLTVNSNDNVFNAHLRFGAAATINGNGNVLMVSLGDLGDAQLFTDGVFTGTIGPNQTVEGSGIINGANGGTIVNNGTINGNHPAVGEDPAIPLQLRGNHDGSGGGVYRSDDGILALDGGLVLDGGTFDSSGVGIVDKTDTGVATISNVTNLGQMGISGQGGFITLVGPLTNNGTLTVNSNLNVFNAHLTFGASTMIDGTGTVRMQMLGDLGDAQMYTDGVFTATIGADQTVAGSGWIDGRVGGTIANNGTIVADDPAFILQLDGNHDGSGGGVYRGDDGVLSLDGGLVMNGGTFDSSGSGSVDKTDAGTATISNMTNLGTLGISGQGGFITLAGPLTNNGEILINSNDNVFNAHLRFAETTTIDGTGTINMELAGNFGDAQILNDVGFVGTIGSGQTVTGSGLVVGEMNMNGTFDPSSDERQIDVDTINMSSTSGLIADLGGLLAGEFDRITVGNSHTINLDGSVSVSLDDGYVPSFGDTWRIVDGGTVVGEFATTTVPAAPLGQIYRVIYEPDHVYVVLTCDADLTGDNILDFFDVSLFLNYFGTGDVRADINGDGFFDFFDVSLFLQLFGGGCS